VKPPPGRPDTGASLIELAVAMSLMSLVGMMAVTGIVNTMRTGTVIERSIDAQAQLDRVYQVLDVRLRYAADINPPVTRNGVALVSLLLDNGPAPRCSQLRLKGDRFAERVWPAGTALPAWRQLADGVSAAATPPGGTTAGPFTTVADPRGYQRLTVALTSNPGSSRDRLARSVQFTVLAQNSLADTRTPVTSCEGDPSDTA